MFGGQKAVADGTSDVISKIARPVTRGADTSLESVAKGVGNKAVKALEPVQARFIPTTEQAIKQLENGYDEIFTATKSGINKLEKSSNAGKDPSRFLAEKGVIPEVSADGKISTELARKQLFDDIEKIDDSLTQGLKNRGKMVNLDDVRAQALKDIDNVQTRADGSLFVRQEEVNKIFDTYKQIYGEQVPLDVLNEIKRGQYRLTKVFDTTKPAFAKDVNYKIGNAAKETIEREATGLNVKDLNRYYGDHLDAIGILEKINGNTVKGGRLGKYFGRATGTILGGTAGTTVGGPIGTLIGGAIGDTVGRILQNKAFQNAIIKPTTRKAIQKGILRGEVGEGKAFQGFGPFNFEK